MIKRNALTVMEKRVIIYFETKSPYIERIKAVLVDNGIYCSYIFQNKIELLQKAKKLKQGIFILESGSSDIGSIYLFHIIKRENPKVRVILLFDHMDVSLLTLANTYGVNGLLYKKMAHREIIKCIEAVKREEFYIDKYLSGTLLLAFPESKDRQKYVLKKLTSTELNILKTLSENKTSKEIAASLGISFRTVQNHRYNISMKLSLKGRNTLLIFARDYKSIFSI